MRRLLALVVVLAAGCTQPAPPPAPVVTAAGLAWRGLAAAPSARTEVTAAALGTKVYVAGGFRADGGTVATVEVFDAATGTWATAPALPVAVNHAMAATSRGTVYVFGGYLANQQPSSLAFRLDSGGWRAVADLPSRLAAGTAAAVDGRIFLAGGVGESGLARQMQVYDPAADTWTTAPGPPTPREHLGGAGYGGRVYTVGGRTSGGNLDAFEAYDPASGSWTRLPALPTARGGLAAAATCAGHVVAVGGEASVTFPEAEVYDVRAGTWGSLPPLPTPRHGLGVVALGADLFTFSGGPRPGLHVADTTEAIDLRALGAC